MQGNASKASTADPFVVMAKPVGPLCNLNCGYCYYLGTERFYSSPHRFRMSDTQLEQFIQNYIKSSPGPVVQFTWHGGEPTLAGLDFYKKALELEKRYLPEGWTCWNNLQTNGVLLDDEWCSFLAREKFDIGLSIDGTEWLHDEYRKDHKGNGTYTQAFEAVKRLQSYGIQPDLLCTVTSSIAKEPVAVYRALRELGTGWIQFIPIVRRTPEGQVTPDSVSGDAYGDFLCAVFDEWIQNDIGKLNVQFFAETMLVWSGGTANLCWMAPTCGRVPVVEHDGSVYSCDHFVTPDHRIGNIDDSSLSELLELPQQRSFGMDKRESLPAQCRTCRWLDVCNGGCPKDRFASSAGGDSRLNHLCSGNQKFFAHAEQPMKQIIKLRKRGFSPAGILAELRAGSKPRWKGVGRNDPCPCGSGRKYKQCCGK